MNQSTTEFLRTDFGHEVYDEWYLGPGSYNFESPEFVESHFRFYEQALMLSNQNVTFVTSAFEEWDSDQKFNLIISATAFHWVDPTVRYLKAYQASGQIVFLLSSQTSTLGRKMDSLGKCKIFMIHTISRCLPTKLLVLQRVPEYWNQDWKLFITPSDEYILGRKNIHPRNISSY